MMKKVNKDPFSNGSEHRAFEAYCCDKCVECGKQAEVWYPCNVDPDIPPHPYCRKCAEKAHDELLFKLFGEEK